MREIGIPFEERLVPFEEDATAAAFRGFSPTGKVPCLIDQRTIVWDSFGITEYLAERHSAVWPGPREARAWSRCAAAEMHSGFNTMREVCTMNCGIRIRHDEMPEALLYEIARLEGLWSEGLDRFAGPFLAGQTFTAVDAFFSPIAFRIQTHGLKLGTTAESYAARLLDLPSMRSWYTDALAETWREPGHEAEAKRAGTWLADLRATAVARGGGDSPPVR
jgi:glutathione S-transferase